MSKRTLKPGWQLWRFDQIAVNVNDRIDNPAEAEEEYYVGLEHLDTDSLKIRRWGTPSDVEATKLRFRKGDIIFGRRRAYQRKLAVADFDGICSAHALVLRAKTEVVLPEFLPFFMQGDLFMNRALEISVGSLSPTINWKTLASQEFALPPLEEQRQLAEILWKIECQQELFADALHKARLVRYAVEKSTFITNSHHNEISLGELMQRKTISFQTGPFGTVLKASSYKDSGYPVVNPSDMVDGRIVLDKCKFVGENDWQRLHKYQVQADDMFIGRKGDMENIVFVDSEHSGYLIGSDCIRFRVHDGSLVPKYLFYYLRADVTRQWLQAQAYGTTMPGINEKLLARMIMYFPDRHTQLDIVNDINSVDCSMDRISMRFSKCHTLKMSILSAV